MNFKINLIFFLSLMVFSSCEKEPTKPKDNDISVTDKGFLVCNEGNFMWGNASLSFYNPTNNIVNADVFKQVNNLPIGDILQSATLFNGNIYLVVNNSGKIEVINAVDFKLVKTISGFKSPRYFLPISNTKAYVSDLYDNALSIVNLETGIVESKINMPGWTEEMLLFNNKVFVTNNTKNYALTVNIGSNQIADTLNCGFASNSIVIDAQNNIWILSAGDATKKEKAFLSCFEPNNLTLIKHLEFSNTGQKKLRINAAGNKLYWISSGDVYAMHTADTVLPTQPFINGDGKTFYGLAVNKVTNELLITDAKDYVQNGAVLIYTDKGEFVKSFSVGVIPNEICFLNQ